MKVKILIISISLLLFVLLFKLVNLGVKLFDFQSISYFDEISLSYKYDESFRINCLMLKADENLIELYSCKKNEFFKYQKLNAKLWRIKKSDYVESIGDSIINSSIIFQDRFILNHKVYLNENNISFFELNSSDGLLYSGTINSVDPLDTNQVINIFNLCKLGIRADNMIELTNIEKVEIDSIHKIKKIFALNRIEDILARSRLQKVELDTVITGELRQVMKIFNNYDKDFEYLNLEYFNEKNLESAVTNVINPIFDKHV